MKFREMWQLATDNEQYYLKYIFMISIPCIILGMPLGFISFHYKIGWLIIISPILVYIGLIILQLSMDRVEKNIKDRLPPEQKEEILDSATLKMSEREYFAALFNESKNKEKTSI